jgi:predicted RNA-binding protein with RPS1 domain
MTPPKHSDPNWDMHRVGAVEPVELPAGETVRAEVVCHHPFGLGLYLPDHDTYGNVNATEVDGPDVHGPEDFPPVGSEVTARVLGLSGPRQLGLSLRKTADRP